MNQIILYTLKNSYYINNNKGAFDVMNFLDKTLFQGWIKRSYIFFAITNLLYLATYDIANNKLELRENKHVTFKEIITFTNGAVIPVFNIIQISLAVGEDLAIIKEKKWQKEDLKK